MRLDSLRPVIASYNLTGGLVVVLGEGGFVLPMFEIHAVLLDAWCERALFVWLRWFCGSQKEWERGSAAIVPITRNIVPGNTTNNTHFADDAISLILLQVCLCRSFCKESLVAYVECIIMRHASKFQGFWSTTSGKQTTKSTKFGLFSEGLHVRSKRTCLAQQVFVCRTISKTWIET